MMKISKNDLFKFYQKSSQIMSEVKLSSCNLFLCSPPFWALRRYTNNDILGVFSVKLTSLL